MGQKSGMGLPVLKSGCLQAEFLPGSSRERPASLLIQLVGRIQFLVVVGLRSHSLNGCRMGALLSNLKPLGLLVMLPLQLQSPHGVFSTLSLSLVCPSVALLLLPAREISLLLWAHVTRLGLPI